MKKLNPSLYKSVKEKNNFMTFEYIEKSKLFVYSKYLQILNGTLGISSAQE